MDRGATDDQVTPSGGSESAVGREARQQGEYATGDPTRANNARPSAKLTEAVDHIYRAGAHGAACWTRNHRGQLRELPMNRWMGGPLNDTVDRLADDHVLARCSARPTLDLGCGPGRFTAALHHRGHAALGVDSSSAAVELTRGRGGTAMRADVFAPLPAEGCWDQVLLTDGNIGIGGDPVRMLRRAACLLAPGGLVIADFDISVAGVWHETLRWENHQHVSPWFPWSRVGADALGDLALAAGLGVSAIIEMHSRVIAVLTVCSDRDL
jgi:SAM-dependent methyltransferase